MYNRNRIFDRRHRRVLNINFKLSSLFWGVYNLSIWRNNNSMQVNVKLPIYTRLPIVIIYNTLLFSTYYLSYIEFNIYLSYRRHCIGISFRTVFDSSLLIRRATVRGATVWIPVVRGGYERWARKCDTALTPNAQPSTGHDPPPFPEIQSDIIHVYII